MKYLRTQNSSSLVPYVSTRFSHDNDNKGTKMLSAAVQESRKLGGGFIASGPM
jgi:hypothetical protein